ncbi:uncharacterized protein [Dysidea avara]|uniref:uncharacterized protein isoform X2 n=1 Tax=Dysidea avara TaxID=196820 RepID=UPI00332FF84F
MATPQATNGTSHLFPDKNNVEQSAADTKTSNGSKSRRQAKESDGINQIIRIHTDQHRAVLNDIDEAIQTVLETGELPLFENEMILDKVFVSILGLLPPTKSSDTDYCIIREVVKQPLFNQRELPVMLSAQAPNISEEYILSHGLIRLLVEVDAVIHSFLRTHLCRNARQVETLIRNTVAMRSPLTTTGQAMNPPPVLVLPSLITSVSVPAGTRMADVDDPVTPDLKPSSSSISCTPTLQSISEGDGDSVFPVTDNTMNGDNSNNNNRFSHIHPLGTDAGYVSGNRSLSSLPDTIPASNKSSEATTPYGGYGANPYTPRTKSGGASQGGSISSAGTDIDDEFQDMNPLIYGVGIETPRVWSTRITQLDDYFASSYGNNYYIDMKYDPSFTIEYLVGPNVNSLNNSMAILRGKQIVISITNNTTNFVGFAIRCYDLNSPHNPRIVYPLMGLEVLEPSSVPWVRNADIPTSGAKQSSYLVLEMFVCRTEMNAVWNVQRRYVISMAEDNHASSSSFNHIGKEIVSLGHNLKQVMMSGLFYMAQDRLSDAEVLFTHALHLPDFQRPEMKAYSLICLAMVLNKQRRSKRRNLVQVIGFTTAAKQLIVTARNINKPRMQTLVELVERLYDDLNLPQLIREARKKQMATPIVDVTDSPPVDLSNGQQVIDTTTATIGRDGGRITHGDSLSVDIPPRALSRPTKISLRKTNKDEELHRKASGMKHMICPLLAVELITLPKVTTPRFSIPITINASLEDCPPTIGLQVRLMHGDTHLQSLNDITDEAEINLDPKNSKLTITTSYEGNFFAAAVCADPVILYKTLLSKVSQTRTPFCLQMGVYSSVFPDDQAVEITIIGVPHAIAGRKDSTAASPSTTGLKQISRRKMIVEVFSDDTLKFELKGNFKPHEKFGETSLSSEFEPSMTTSYLNAKWIQIISLGIPRDGSSRDFVVSGKMIISRKKEDGWQEMHSINLFG